MLLGLSATVACVAVAPDDSRAEPDSRPGAQTCNARVMIQFAEPPTAGDRTAPDVSAIALSAGVELEFLRTAGSDIFVFSLMDEGSDASCGPALARLRSDPRVRSVDIDVKRTRH